MTYHPELWDYSGWAGKPTKPFGDEVTYKKGLGWLYEGCDSVEDWGAGLGYGRRFCPAGKSYVAIDASPASRPWVDVISNLLDWQSEPEGLFMRHVLEHNLEWEKVLRHALDSFERRMVLVTFTPFSAQTMALAGTHPILDLSFRKQEVDDLIAPLASREEHWATSTQYGQEHVWYVTK